MKKLLVFILSIVLFILSSNFVWALEGRIEIRSRLEMRF